MKRDSIFYCAGLLTGSGSVLLISLGHQAGALALMMLISITTGWYAR